MALLELFMNIIKKGMKKMINCYCADCIFFDGYYDSDVHYLNHGFINEIEQLNCSCDDYIDNKEVSK